MKIELSEPVAAALQAQAAAHGLTVDAYLQRLVLPSPSPSKRRLTVEELDRLLDEAAITGPSPTGTFSRAEIYIDHD